MNILNRPEIIAQLVLDGLLLVLLLLTWMWLYDTSKEFIVWLVNQWR